MTKQPAYMGQFLRQHQERKFNLNTFINRFSAPRYAFGTTAIITQEKKFPDVSFYQKVINYLLMRSMTDTMIIRAGQNNWVDTEFIRNWTNAKAEGMKRGLYWFFDGRVTPQSQAEILANLIKSDMPEMEIWIDWETNYGGAYEGIKNVVAMMKHIEILLPAAKVGVYTGYYFFIQNSNAITHAAEYAYLKTKPLWLAWYTNDASIVKIPAPWSSLLLWQFGTPAVGYEYGCGTLNLDMNYFNGSLTEFTARYGTPTPPPIGGVMETWKVIITELNVRSGIGTGYPVITTVKKDDIIEGVLDAVSNWIHISKRNGVALDGWCSGNALYVTKYTPPPPAPAYPDLPVSITLGDDVTYIKQIVNITLKPK